MASFAEVLTSEQKPILEKGSRKPFRMQKIQQIFHADHCHGITLSDGSRHQQAEGHSISISGQPGHF